MPIRTKIVATVGPASGAPETLRRMVDAGVDVFRINFSHGDEVERGRYLAAIRRLEVELGEPIAVLADLGGPKIRVGPMDGGEALLVEGARLAILREPVVGTASRIGTTLPELVDELRPGQQVLLDDGRLRLEVEEVSPPDEVICRVVRGGPLRSGKGLNLPDTELTLSALTDKDRRDVAWIATRDVDFVALSFVRRAADVVELAGLLRELGSTAEVVAKIEKPQALADLEAIVEASDAVMVARGDLGVEMDLPAVPVAQKRIATACQAAGKPCIIATQMLESMMSAPSPTRAEVSDAANAVLDRADAVMLSGETAAGAFPVEAVAVLNEVVGAIECYHDETATPARLDRAPARTVAALAWAAREIVVSHEAAAVAVFTATGETARLLAKSRLPCPVLAMSPDALATRRAGLYYGVVPVRAETPEHTRDVLALASRHAVERGLARPGDHLVVLSGRPLGAPGATNTLVVHRIPG